jgi:hypothetical protein
MKYIETKFSNFIKENILTIPDIPNTMNFWHGGNLDEYNEIISQKNGRYEYGPGLYLTTRWDTAKKYSKGSRKLYLITVENGNEISDVLLDRNMVNEFISDYIIKSKQKEIIKHLNDHTKDNVINASIFNNVVLNSKGLPSSRTNLLRSFLVENDIDYEMVNNPFGFSSERMLVLYNMKKIVNTIVVKPNYEIDTFNL